jgi:hypothetical protein
MVVGLVWGADFGFARLPFLSLFCDRIFALFIDTLPSLG